jgi:hypothetical protein
MHFKLHILLHLVGRDRLPGVADRPNLSYTEAVLHESMRLASILPNGLIHQASCDSEVCKWSDYCVFIMALKLRQSYDFVLAVNFN